MTKKDSILQSINKLYELGGYSMSTSTKAGFNKIIDVLLDNYVLVPIVSNTDFGSIKLKDGHTSLTGPFTFTHKKTVSNIKAESDVYPEPMYIEPVSTKTMGLYSRIEELFLVDAIEICGTAKLVLLKRKDCTRYSYCYIIRLKN